MVMDLLLSHKSSLDLMQNCDLPPPAKVFTGPCKAVAFSIGEKHHEQVCKEENEEIDTIGTEFEKLELLKALRLSQTRAREAENRVAILSGERDRLLKAFMDDAPRLSAYRQWVSMLELELLKLKRQEWRTGSVCDERNGTRRLWNNKDDNGNEGNFTWFMLTLCFGIAGVTFAFGCRYLA